MRGISWLAEGLLTSQEELCSIQSVKCIHGLTVHLGRRNGWNFGVSTVHQDGLWRVFFPSSCMLQQPNSGLNPFIVEAYGSHTITHTHIERTHKHIISHTHTVGLPCKRDQLVEEAATCTTQQYATNKHPCSQGLSDSQSQQSDSCGPTPLRARQWRSAW